MSGALLTVAFVDVERSTELLVERGDRSGQAALDAVLAVARERIEPYGGREIKALGDGLMLAFAAPRQAVTFAIAVQRALLPRGPRLRIGINTGEVEGSLDDPVGEAVNAAARIAAKAGGSEVVVSDVVRQLVGTIPGVRFVDRGRVQLKGFPERWRLFTATAADTASEPAATFGRAQELLVVDDLVAAVRHGPGHVLVVEGEAGIGKTHLANRASALATAAGFAVLSAGTDELEPDQPGRVIEGYARTLGVNVGAPPDDEAAGSRGFALCEAVANAIEDLGTTRPVLLLAEDLHWADDLSIRGLATLSRRTATLPVAIVMTLRPTPRSPAVDRLLTVLRNRGGRVLRLDGLDDVAVTAMAAALVGAPPGPRLTARLASAAGNPLFVAEYLRVVDEESALDVRGGIAEIDHDTLPAGVRETVLRRVTALPPVSVETLRLASLLGREFTLRDLAVVAGRPVVNVAADLRAPVDAVLLTGERDTLSFRHDLVREAVYDDIPPAIRRDLHAAAGDALAAAGAPVLQVARQFELGARPGDEEAVGWLERAAQEALTVDVASAVRLLERAINLCDDPSALRTRLEIALLEPLANSGRVEDARAIGQALLDRELDAREAFVVRRGLAVGSTSSGDLDRGVADFETAADTAGATADEALTLRCLAANIACLTGRSAADVIAIGEATLAMSEQSGSGEQACVAHQTLAVAAGGAGRYAEGANHARASRRLLFAGNLPTRGFLIPDIWEATFLVSKDDFDDALAGYDAARVRAERRGELSVLVQTHTGFGGTHFLRGRWDDAVSEIEAGIAVASETGNHAHDIACHALLAHIAFARGEAPAARAALAVANAALRDGRHLFGVDILAWVEAEQLRANGDAAGARDWLAGTWAAIEPIRGLTQFRLLGPSLCRVAVETGDTAAATRIAETMAHLGSVSATPSAIAAAARCEGLASRNIDALIAAVDAYRSSPRRLEFVGTCEDAATLLFAEGRNADAASLLEEAAAIHAEGGATNELARLDTMLKDHGVKRRRRPAGPKHGWDSLSPTERKVVTLVARGQSNPRIAAALFISRRTVETHVSHIFRKVDVASRAELAAAAVSHGYSASS